MRTSPGISVFIPTYRPDPGFLRRTLLSVLTQEAEANIVEIVVVDDASPDNRPDETVWEVGDGRVTLFRQARNLGLAANWNACIGRARGEWVHLLHQDDWVYPGFYRTLQPALGHSNAAIAFSRHEFVDSAGKIIGVSTLERASAGVLQDFLNRIAAKQRIQFSSALLRKSACLAVGGFNTSLAFALDWEMWARLASQYDVWFEPALLACFRIHEKSAGWNLAKAGVLARDYRRAIGLITSYVPPAARPEIRRLALQHAASYGIDMAARLVDNGCRGPGVRCGLESVMLSRRPENFVAFLRLTCQAVFAACGDLGRRASQALRGT